MRRTGKRSESPYNEVNTTDPTVQGVYNYLELASKLSILFAELNKERIEQLWYGQGRWPRQPPY